MPLSQVQIEVSSDPSRFKVVVAGRRWGKSFLAMHEIAKHARFPGSHVFAVFPSYRQAKQIIWDPLKEKFIRCRWVKKINESDLTITLINGSKIYLRSADNPDSLRGVSMDYLIMDEAAMIDQKMWTEVCRPALSDKKGSALFITTPKGKGSWIYELWQGANAQDNWKSFQYTTLQGGNVDADEIKRVLDKNMKQALNNTAEAFIIIGTVDCT